MTLAFSGIPNKGDNIKAVKALSFFSTTQLWMKTNLDQISIPPLCRGMS